MIQGVSRIKKAIAHNIANPLQTMQDNRSTKKEKKADYTIKCI